MNMENIKNDIMFMKFIKSEGTKKIYDANDFKVGDKVITIPLDDDSVFVDSSGNQIFVNNDMAKDSLNCTILTIRSFTGSNSQMLIQLSNGWTYLPEMINKIDLKKIIKSLDKEND